MRKITQVYGIKGEITKAIELGDGGIHKTYCIRMDTGKRYILQKMNTKVFRKPEEVMENIAIVTGCLREHSPEIRTLEFRQTEKGSYLYDGWRAMEYLDGYSRKSVRELHQIQQMGEAFGRFQKAVSGIDSGRLKEVIPGFHDTEGYYRELEELETDIPEKAILEEWKEKACYVCEAYRQQGIDDRVTHGDVKCSNLLFDRETDQPLAVIDLDTVMPGKAVYDFGDAVRSLSRNGVDMEQYKVFAEGYLHQTEYTEAERALLIPSVFSVTVELAVRYLADYLKGNIYFKVNQPEENLHRARQQIRLAKEMQKHQAEMENLIYGIYRSSERQEKHPEVYG